MTEGGPSADVPMGTIESWLWTAPEHGVKALPTVTEVETLPLGDLSFRDAERLFLSLIHI